MLGLAIKGIGGKRLYYKQPINKRGKKEALD